MLGILHAAWCSNYSVPLPVNRAWERRRPAGLFVRHASPGATTRQQVSGVTTMCALGSIVIGGAGSNRWLSIYPPADTFGVAAATIAVLDGTGLSATARFQVELIPVNDPPQLSPIPDQTALLGQTLLPI